MARIRYIKPEFFEDEKVGSLSLQARLLFISMWTLADRNGIFEYSPAVLKARTFPFDDISKEQVHDFANELSKLTLVSFLDYGKKTYCRVNNFEKHQFRHKNEAPKFSHIAELWPSPHCVDGTSTVQAPSLDGEKPVKTKGERGTDQWIDGSIDQWIDGERINGERITEQQEPPAKVIPISMTGSVGQVVVPTRPATQLGKTLPTPSELTECYKLRCDLHRRTYEIPENQPDLPRTEYDERIFYELLAESDLETVKQMLMYFYAIPNNFYRQKAHDLRWLRTDKTKLRTEVAKGSPILPDQRAESFNKRKQSASVKQELLRRAKERSER